MVHHLWLPLLILVLCMPEMHQMGLAVENESLICNIPTINIADDDDTGCEAVLGSGYVGSMPFIVKFDKISDSRRRFREQTSLPNLLKNCETCKNLMVDVSTANSYTGRQVHTMSLVDYLEHYLVPQNASVKGNETLYLFGGHNSKEWNAFLDDYVPAIRAPTESILLKHKLATRRKDDTCDSIEEKKIEPNSIVLNGSPKGICLRILPLLKQEISLSFGIASQHTGVPFHQLDHGPGYLESVHGRKHMFLIRPGESFPEGFDPDENVITWFERYRARLEGHGSEDTMMQCTIESGDILYFPDKWLHATLNLDNYNVFVANFG